MNSLLIQYVDPGAGSLITQLLLSLFIGLGFYVFSFRRRISDRLRRLSGKKVPSPKGEVTEKVRPSDSNKRLD